MTLKTCEFTVWGKPTGKGRPRFTRSGHAYTPQNTRDYESLVKQNAWAAMHKSGLTMTNRRVSVILTFLFDIPKSYSKAKTIECQCGVLIPPRIDIDNLSKSILDGCNEMVYRDDAQVWHLSAFKRYCDVGQEAQTQVKIQWDEPSEYS